MAKSLLEQSLLTLMARLRQGRRSRLPRVASRGLPIEHLQIILVLRLLSLGAHIFRHKLVHV